MGSVIVLEGKLVKKPSERWTATLWYRAAHGLVEVAVHFEELEELHDIVERGPDWNTLDRIEVRLTRNSTPNLTVERSETL